MAPPGYRPARFSHYEWRKVWKVAGLLNLAASTAARTASCTRLLSRWCFLSMFWCGFRQCRSLGNCLYQPCSLSAFRYFLSKALRRADQFPPTTFSGGRRWDAALLSISTRTKPLWAESHTFLSSYLPVSLPDLVHPQPVSALSQPSASTTHNPTSWQNRSIND